jgi:hypothetical protein
MSNDTLSYLIAGLCCLGFLALVVLACVSSFGRLRRFSTAVRAKKSGWDALIARTGLQWESKAPAYNPVADRLFGGDVAAKTGRVVGTYRGYPVALANQTRDQLSQSMFVTGQTYYTEFRLTVRNPAGVRVAVRKDDRRLTVEPQEAGTTLLAAARAFERLNQLPASFGIEVQQQHLVYVQAGMEEDANRLLTVLEILCDLADAVGSYSSH